MLRDARELRRVLGDDITLIMNDRADICIAAGFQGVHVGQEDLSPEGARTVIGPERILGVSTHNLEQLQQADAGPADYIAFWPRIQHGHRNESRCDRRTGWVCGPRGTPTKKPLVAIGGITRANAAVGHRGRSDSVAVIADLLSSPAKVAEEFRACWCRFFAI